MCVCSPERLIRVRADASEDHEAEVALCPAAWPLRGRQRQIQAAGQHRRTGAEPRSAGREESQRSALYFTAGEISIRAFSGRRHPTQNKGGKESKKERKV